MIYLKRALKNTEFVILLLCAVLIFSVTAFAPFFAPNDPIANDYENMLISGSGKYLLGTDQIGRCILSRLIYGGRTSLLIVFFVIAIVSTIGVFVGLLSGFIGGRLDNFIMRGIDIIIAVPETIFVIALVAVMGSSLKNTVIAMSLVGWTVYARITRALVISIKNEPYITEAVLGGLGKIQIIKSYIIPNVIPYLIVNITQDIGNNLLTLAGLSLLGLASQPPTPEWGYMLSEGRRFIQTAPHMIIYPGLAILVNVIIFNLMGDKLRDILDPRFENRNAKKV